MHGNMYEWCHDWSQGNTVDVLTDPIGPRGGMNRVLRGGSWVNDTTYCRSADQNNSQPAFTINSSGFRVVFGIGVQSSQWQLIARELVDKHWRYKRRVGLLALGAMFGVGALVGTLAVMV